MVNIKRIATYIPILLIAVLLPSCQDAFLITDIINGTDSGTVETDGPGDTGGAAEPADSSSSGDTGTTTEEPADSGDTGSTTEEPAGTGETNMADGTDGFLYYNSDIALLLEYNPYDSTSNYQGKLELGAVSFSNGWELTLTIITKSDKNIPLHSDNTALKCYLVDRGAPPDDWRVLSDYRSLYTAEITAGKIFTQSIKIPITSGTIGDDIILAIYSDSATEEITLTINSITITSNATG